MPVSNRNKTFTKVENPSQTTTFPSENFDTSMSIATKIVSVSKRHDNNFPLWQGPCADGPLGGITQSMLVRFMSCRERFRLKYILGLEPADKWNKNLGYGNMWHVCEEGLAKLQNPEVAEVSMSGQDPVGEALIKHTQQQLKQYPMQGEEITKWYNVCKVQFSEYVRYWSQHPDVKNRKPLLQEQVFNVPYTLPSGRTVYLRGKFDSVDLITSGAGLNDLGVYLQENKTKGDIDQVQIERQLKFDLQTMLYLLVLELYLLDITGNSHNGADRVLSKQWPIKGVRYNVVRRPLSGGVGSIRPHAAKSTKTKITPAETDEQFYERLRRDYLAADPAHWFFRVKSEVSAKDIQVFCNKCLNPLLEQLCWWYDDVTERGLTEVVHDFGFPPLNYRTPFGVWSALEENGSTEYDAYLSSESEAGLRRVETLFGELQ